jgi:hypothetical protein
MSYCAVAELEAYINNVRTKGMKVENRQVYFMSYTRNFLL